MKGMDYQKHWDVILLAFGALVISDILAPCNLRKEKGALKNHMDFTFLEKDNLHKELGEAKKLLEEIGEEVKNFGSPYDLDKRVKDLKNSFGEKEVFLNFV